MDKENFRNHYPEKKTELLKLLDCDWFWVVGEDRILCNLCPYRSTCERLRERVTRHDVEHGGAKQKFYVKYNCAVRYEPNGEVEFVKYKKPWELEIKDEVLDNNYVEADRSKLLAPRADGTYEVIKDTFTYQKLYRSMKNSRNRSIQKFFNYAISNEWKYFITLTFSPKHVNRYDDMEVISKWSVFQTWLKKKNPNVKALIVPEYHESENELGERALYFHGFLSDCPNVRLEPAVNVKTGEYLYSNVDKIPLLHLIDWKYGFSTVAVIPVDNNNRRIANYMTKYMFKNADRVGYGKKLYYHTKNLNMSESINYLFPDKDFEKIIAEYNLEEVKSVRGMTVYRGKLKREDEE